MDEYIPTIGLEIHAELKTNSKMFCSCKNDPDEEVPNKNICPICLAHPGTLPLINEEGVKGVIKSALALNCKLERNTYFERKNYFYPDLPKGYQISQFALPLSRNGYLNINSGDSEKKIRIERIHLEEDTGKLIHPSGKDYSLVDFNRAGVPLMELVTEPDIETDEEAYNFAKELQLILKYLDVSEANMEKGQMRCEVNISMRKKTDKKLGTKVEIKNLNSLRAVKGSIAYEMKRQEELLRNGKEVKQETRGWNETKGETFSQREKEESHDYRYFPEPDLPPIEIEEDLLDKIKIEIPELPYDKRKRFKEEYNISEEDLMLYVSQKDLGEYFEKVISELKNWEKNKKQEKEIEEKEFNKLIKVTSNYISSDLQGLLAGKSVEGEEFKITPENFAEFVSMIHMNGISSKMAKELLPLMYETGRDPSQIVEDKGMKMISSEDELEKIIEEVISENSNAVDDYKNGEEKAIKFLVGQVMAKTKGQAEPRKANELLKEKLSNL